MELEYLGGNCLRIKTKKAVVVVDDNLKSLGLKPALKPDNIAIYTANPPQDTEASFVIDTPGEYEVSDISVHAIAARGHMDEEGKKSAVMYRLTINDVKIGIIGHIYPELTDVQLEALGTIDILFVPVGGHGFTLDAVGALKIVRKIEPKVVIPTNYADSSIKYEVPASDLETAIKGLSMEPSETLDKLKIKSRDFAEGTHLIVLNRQ